MTKTKGFAAASSTLDMLKAVREKVEAGWTQKVSARNAAGNQVWIDDPGATCFCLSGAAAVVRPKIGFAASDILAKALGFKDTSALIAWNDRKGRTQAEVLLRLDTAIAEGGGQ